MLRTKLQNCRSLLGFLTLVLLWTQPQIALSNQNNNLNVQFTVGPNFVHMPEKYFVLVRKGREIGAFRFTSIKEDSLGNGRSTYESFFQKDGLGAFKSANVLRTFGKIDIKPMKSITHSLTWQPGHDELRIGNWLFGCYSPSLVNMSSRFSEKDEGYEFAPTSAQAIDEVDAADKRLRWFRFNADTSIPLNISELPK